MYSDKKKIKHSKTNSLESKVYKLSTHYYNINKNISVNKIIVGIKL